ncbi:U2 protein [Berne virus]|nr:U2 protein [Berne virus]
MANKYQVIDSLWSETYEYQFQYFGHPFKNVQDLKKQHQRNRAAFVLKYLGPNFQVPAFGPVFRYTRNNGIAFKNGAIYLGVSELGTQIHINPLQLFTKFTVTCDEHLVHPVQMDYRVYLECEGSVGERIVQGVSAFERYYPKKQLCGAITADPFNFDWERNIHNYYFTRNTLRYGTKYYQLCGKHLIERSSGIERTGILPRILSECQLPILDTTASAAEFDEDVICCGFESLDITEHPTLAETQPFPWRHFSQLCNSN